MVDSLCAARGHEELLPTLTSASASRPGSQLCGGECALGGLSSWHSVRAPRCRSVGKETSGRPHSCKASLRMFVNSCRSPVGGLRVCSFSQKEYLWLVMRPGSAALAASLSLLGRAGIAFLFPPCAQLARLVRPHCHLLAGGTVGVSPGTPEHLSPSVLLLGARTPVSAGTVKVSDLGVSTSPLRPALLLRSWEHHSACLRLALSHLSGGAMSPASCVDQKAEWVGVSL